MSSGMASAWGTPSTYTCAVSVSRSAMPRKSASDPMGSSSGATPAPSSARSSSSVRSKLARSRSSLFTNTMRGTPRRAASRQIAAVCTSTPSTADTTNTARSTTRRAAMTSPRKSAYPGVSTRLTLWPFHSKGANARDRDSPRRCSSGSWSQTVDPSSTRPSRLMAPARWSNASANVVLPAPPWPTRATLRSFSDGKCCTRIPLAWARTTSAGRVPNRPRRLLGNLRSHRTSGIAHCALGRLAQGLGS